MLFRSREDTGDDSSSLGDDGGDDAEEGPEVALCELCGFGGLDESCDYERGRFSVGETPDKGVKKFTALHVPGLDLGWRSERFGEALGGGEAVARRATLRRRVRVAGWRLYRSVSDDPRNATEYRQRTGGDRGEEGEAQKSLGEGEGVHGAKTGG